MSPAFIHDKFVLESPLAVELYRRFAADAPIIDWHSHLPVAQLASNHRFRSITEAWLAGDHYKWRAMRTNGIPERLITGDASDWEKFEAWARTVPETLGNPLYHWTHMELKRPFGIDRLLGPDTARQIYERANARLREDGFTTLGLLEGFRVAVACTTDDPADSLEHHKALARRPNPATCVFPTWRADQAFAVEDPAAWNAWTNRLEAASGIAVRDLTSLMDALENRHAAFHEAGCRAADHGLEQAPGEPASEAEAAKDVLDLRAGRTLGTERAHRLQSALLQRVATLHHARSWAQQLHLGALRNVNTRYQRLIGRDSGFDVIGDFDQARPLARFLDRLDATNQLAKTIVFNLNPRDNQMFVSLIGGFQDGSTPGKLQYGPAWWFLDQKDGMEAQLVALANLGLLSRFVGMVTDSRSFLSFSRHDCFRRILCNWIAEQVRRGLVPNDKASLGGLVRRISFENARDYFGYASLGHVAGPTQKAARQSGRKAPRGGRKR
jgi:glucuronate isomerase